jgi:hypothetical protein
MMMGFIPLDIDLFFKVFVMTALVILLYKAVVQER